MLAKADIIILGLQASPPWCLRIDPPSDFSSYTFSLFVPVPNYW
jgi:hypothetical protein